MGNYDSFNWKQALLGGRVPKQFVKKLKILHLLWGITLWMIWIERNDRVFNHEQWHESKMKNLIWDNLIMYAKAACITVAKFVEIGAYMAKALLKGFDEY